MHAHDKQAGTAGPALVLVERRGPSLVLTLNAPEQRNALCAPMRDALKTALLDAEADDGVRAIVIQGAGGTFSAGGDIRSMQSRVSAAQAQERLKSAHRLVDAIVRNTKPVIAAVDGWAAGGGFALALCCDTIVATPRAKFVAGFGKIGLLPDLGLIHTLPARVGAGHARRLLMYDEAMDAEQALSIGMVDAVVQEGQLAEASLAFAQRLERIAPLSVALTKRWLGNCMERALEEELNLQSMMFLTEDHAEGVRAFLEKRPPVFRNR